MFKGEKATKTFNYRLEVDTIIISHCEIATITQPDIKTHSYSLYQLTILTKIERLTLTTSNKNYVIQIN